MTWPPASAAGSPATSAPAPGEACPLCGAPLHREQEWCLRCGAAARTRLAAAPNWRAPLAALAIVIVLSLGVLAAALVKLAGPGSSAAAITTLTRAPAPSAPSTSLTPTTSLPATTAPGTTIPHHAVPGAATPGSSVPGAGTRTGKGAAGAHGGVGTLTTPNVAGVRPALEARLRELRALRRAR